MYTEKEVEALAEYLLKVTKKRHEALALWEEVSSRSWRDCFTFETSVRVRETFFILRYDATEDGVSSDILIHRLPTSESLGVELLPNRFCCHAVAKALIEIALEEKK